VPARDNEIRGMSSSLSVNRLIHLRLVISGILAGIGGALAALAVEHVDPNMGILDHVGRFVFVTILAGAGSVAAAFWARWWFELVRSIAVDLMPNTLQIILGRHCCSPSCSCPRACSLFHRLRRTPEKA